MGECLLSYTHRARDCPRIVPEFQNVAQELKGKKFFCTCPNGDHGGFFQVEASRSEEALNSLPEAIRATTQVIPRETMARDAPLPGGGK